VVLFDGRSKRCRRQIEKAEEQLAASGAHKVKELWIVYSLPAKVDDPRASNRQTSFMANNKEVCICSMPIRKGTAKIVALRVQRVRGVVHGFDVVYRRAAAALL